LDYLFRKNTNMKKAFSHLDKSGKPSMVDVSSKPATLRTASARAIVELGAEIMSRLEGNEIVVPKGAVFQTAIIAGVLAAKKTGELIPLCHPLGLENCQISISQESATAVRITCIASLTGKTGVEMEALTGATIAALTIYDMCKALSHDITIREVCLVAKTGGKHDFQRP
jgi:cyclic pyranopterin phosphate synthase